MEKIALPKSLWLPVLPMPGSRPPEIFTFSTPSLKSLRYFTSSTAPPLEAMIGTMVASELLLIAQKYGIAMKAPIWVEEPKDGMSTPLARFTEGSGCDRYGE